MYFLFIHDIESQNKQFFMASRNSVTKIGFLVANMYISEKFFEWTFVMQNGMQCISNWVYTVHVKLTLLSAIFQWS